MNWALILVITLAAGGIGGTIIFLIDKYAGQRAEAARLKAELEATRRVLSNEQKASDLVVEHRSDDDTAGRLRDGTF